MIMDKIELGQQIIQLRVLFLLGPVSLVYLLLCFRAITYRQLTGIYLSTLWCFLSLLFLNPLIIELGGWEYKVSKITFMQIPMDVLIGWAVFWGAIPHLIKIPGGVFSWVALLFLLDLAVMPLLEPLVQIQSGWQYWDALCLLIAFVPSWYLARWTARRDFLYVRSFMQLIMFVLIFNWMIPVSFEPHKIGILIHSLILGKTITTHGIQMAFWDNSGMRWEGFIYWGTLLLFITIPGISAVQEFAARGWGTPFPLDPPVKLVTTGPYAYIANPMQASQTLIYVWMGVGLNSIGFYFAGLMVILFAIGYAKWEEEEEIKKRFGNRAFRYKVWVRRFIPRWKPWRKKPATIYLDLYGCIACSNLGRVLLYLQPTLLIIKDARFYASEDLMRMAYKDVDGFEAQGIHALGRALEHVNLMWALVGWTVRLPGISQLGQWIIDAVFPPHRVCRVPEVE